jgi:acetyl esterase
MTTLVALSGCLLKLNSKSQGMTCRPQRTQQGGVTMALGPEATAFVDMVRASGAPPLSSLSPEAAREVINAMLGNPGDVPDLAVSDQQVGVAGGSILVRVVEPVAAPRGVIVYLHGGGFVTGTAANHEPVCRQIAAATGCIVAIPDYRLAPEFRFPIPLEDCLAALTWAAGCFDLPLVAMGDSAGGNLAAAVAQMAAKASGPQVAAQVLLYPVMDSAMDTASYANPANQLLLTKETGDWFWDHYLPDKTQRSDPRASPLRAGSLSGLPPTIIVLASYDILLDEGQAYADRLVAAGVSCDLMIAEGEIHGFFVMGGIMPAARTALEFVTDKLAAHLA